MDPNREHSGRAKPPAAGHLRGLLELARLVRSGCELPELLGAVAKIVSETLGFGTVVINLYRPDSDEYEVKAVLGNDRAREILLGHVSAADTWTPMLDPRFMCRGAFFVPAEGLDWDKEVTAYTPELEAAVDDPCAWRADDALFVPLDASDGRRLGMIAVDEPESGRRPDDQLLDVLVAVAAHAAQAIESSYQLADLQDALARQRALVETSLDAVISLDRDGRVLEFNPAAELMFGYSKDRILGQELAELLIEPQDRDAHRRGLTRAFELGDGRALHRRMEVTAVCADGRRLPVELSLTLVAGARPSEAIMYGVARDISERLRGQQQLAYLAYHDRLTGLPNRVLVEDQLDLAVARARRMNRAVALLFVDLDDFKAVNDRLGHAAGDQFLAAVAARLRGVLRDTDVLARQGGDEFLVLLSDLDDDPEHVAESVGAKLHIALQQPFSVAGSELLTAASVGVSLYPDDASDSEALLRHADAAMYKAKAAGGGQLAFHRAAETIIARRASVSAQLRRAIAQSELELHYQPVWRLGAERGIVGVEALLRWSHPDRGLLKPDAFIALAEHSAVGDDLVDWVLHEACADVRRWSREFGLQPRVGLNVSPHQLLASEFPARMQDVLRSHDVDPSAFLIELTESAWAVDAADTLAALAELRAAGTALAIDDFGAGFSSLSRLHQLDVDVVKLDRVLLGGIPDDTTAASVLRAVIDLARVGEAAIIAEGVETVAQTDWLMANGIEHAQGYLFGQPLRADELTPVLTRCLLPRGVST
jgi:diguanylate cyclase (GGDEF)-like protein/PAS domain S-box-containing protein